MVSVACVPLRSNGQDRRASHCSVPDPRARRERRVVWQEMCMAYCTVFCGTVAYYRLIPRLSAISSHTENFLGLLLYWRHGVVWLLL
jgi:hypothetical protein